VTLHHPLPPAALAERVIAFFRRRQRDLPWRRSRDPYAIWVSEIMLQQTRIETAIPYFERWMERFPTALALAGADAEDVLAAWSGLGYYSRARNLHRAATVLARDRGGALPETATELAKLPGIGRYTAGAIASQAFGRSEPVVDGNVARVLARLYGFELDVKSSGGARGLWEIAAALVPARSPGDFNQGLMELGQTICTPRKPRCGDCPLASACRARASGRQSELPRLPRRRAAADKPLIDLAATWVLRQGQVLLARRPARGLYGGLWELPAASSPDQLAAALPRLALETAPAAVHEHELSHRRMRIRVWRGALARKPRRVPAPYAELRWHRLASIAALGVSSPTRVLARELTKET
jgi:A/G-specific adenine glycosylase